MPGAQALELLRSSITFSWPFLSIRETLGCALVWMLVLVVLVLSSSSPLFCPLLLLLLLLLFSNAIRNHVTTDEPVISEGVLMEGSIGCIDSVLMGVLIGRLDGVLMGG